eukprot:1565146-Amphidinium_carterae.2
MKPATLPAMFSKLLLLALLAPASSWRLRRGKHSHKYYLRDCTYPTKIVGNCNSTSDWLEEVA